MTNQIKILALGLLVFVGSATVALSQGTPTVATVDLERAFQEYYKAQEATERLRRQAQRADADTQDLRIEGEALQEELQAVIQRFQNPVASEEARKEAAQEAQRIQQQLQLKQREFQEHLQRVQQTLQRREQTIIRSHVDEIRQVVSRVAQNRNVDIVLNSNPVTNQVLFSDPAFDLTDVVIEELNRDRPSE